MKKGRIVASALAVSVGLSACAAEESTNDGSNENEVSDWGDEGKYPEVGGAYHSLAALAGTCAYDTTTKVVTITSTGAQTIIVGKRAVDSALLVNNVACSTATTKDLKRIVVNGAASAVDEIVIVDFLGGLYAAATATAGVGGIEVNLGAGTGDELRIRGQSVKDTFYMGSDNGISFNADAYKDIAVSGVEGVSVATAGGDDVFSATNPVAVRGVTGNATLPLKLSGGAGNDDITGGDGIDNIYGGLGDDSLTGGLLADNIYGEDGADTIKSLNVTDGDDVIDCGLNAGDTVSYAARTQVITAVLGTGGGMASEADTYANCENLTGGSGDDVLTGKAAEANVIKGGAGNDTLTGLTGNDSLYGESGNDTFDEVDYTKGAGNDVIDGGDGTDTVDYSSRSGTLTVTMDGKAADDGESGETDNVAANVENLMGGTGSNNITGNTLNNVLTGNTAADTLSGGDGNDTLVGGANTDTLNGGNGDDIFDEGSAANGGDVFNGGAGVDTVDYSARSTTVTVTMALNAANDGDSTSAEGDNVKDDCENVYGGSAIDNLTGNDLDNLILGGGGLDVISGLAGDDFIDGEGALATVDCGDGDDIAVNTSGTATACEL